MVVSIHTHFLQVVVLAAYTQALLGIGYTGMIGYTIAEEVVFELVHTCIGKQQGGVVLDHYRCRGHNIMSFAFEKV